MSGFEKRGWPFEDALHLRLDCQIGAVRQGAAQVKAFLSARGLPERDVWACELAFVEGCNNAIQNTPPGMVTKQLVVGLVCRGGSVELRIEDHTGGYDLPSFADLPEMAAESGRGIYLMRSLMDEVDYIRGDASNCLVLKKTLTGI